jgi:SAM-dependent methyltransferase
MAMDMMPMPEPENAVSDRVRSQYTRAPFPPVSFFPIVPGPPQQRVWLYGFAEAYYHAFRVRRNPAGARLLDAGCGTGHGVHQIRHLAPGAEVHACDFSAASLAFARQRIEALGEGSVTFHEQNLLDLSALPGEFDAIFCSGVVHHTANPVRALQQLKSKLKPDGVLYLMLYSRFGRRPTILMQQVIKLLTRNSADQQEGLRLGRMLFDSLPPANPIATWEREKWGDNHRKHAEAFIDMYVNANERNYSIREVYADLAAAGLKFVRFSNPQAWNLAGRMAAQPELLARFVALPELEQYELIEHLFPDQDQYLFYATHAENPMGPPEWAGRGTLAGMEDRLTATRAPLAAEIKTATPRPGHALWRGYFDLAAWLDAPSVDLLASCDGRRTIRQITAGWEQAHGPEVQGKGSEIIRALEDHGLVYVTDVRMEL